jgi:DNA-directed RNA polymerase specialized sigma24 family protein
MNDISLHSIAWIAAQADRPKAVESVEFPWKRQGQEGDSLGQTSSVQDLPVADLSVAGIPLIAHEVANLPVHQFPAKSPVQPSQPVTKEATETEDVAQALQQTQDMEQAEAAQDEAEFRDDDRERRIYRGRTVAMLRRYMRYSIETGRLPSLLGREFFRTQITKYQVATFEDRVIFVHDMDRCLDQLDEFSREVLGRVVLQEYEHEEAARLMGCTRMTVHRKLVEALDALSDILITVGLLDALGANSKKILSRG